MHTALCCLGMLKTRVLAIFRLHTHQSFPVPSQAVFLSLFLILNSSPAHALPGEVGNANDQLDPDNELGTPPIPPTRDSDGPPPPTPPSPPTPPPPPTERQQQISKAEQLLQRAIEIRDSAHPTERELQKSVEFLYAAAGIEHLSVDKTKKNKKTSTSTQSSTTNNDSTTTTTTKDSTGTSSADASKGVASFATAEDIKIQWRNGTVLLPAAVKELIFVFREGDGAPLNPAIAHRLLLELAATGDAEAQADVAFYLAQGLVPVAPNSRGQLFILEPADIPAALVYYYFAARSGDLIAQLALGYRYLHGLGVPKSCQNAALYYAPVAERVLELAKQRDTLPQTRQMRLSHKTASTFRTRPSMEQEFLHYQWFADYGHADAARAVAHLLSHGAARDHAAAVQYLRRAADTGDPDAMAHLGHMHANGLAVERDNATAWKWFWRAAERGHASGFFGMGYMHLTGEGAEVDYKQAFHYFKQAVEAGGQWTGLGDALFFLGKLRYISRRVLSGE